VNDLARCRPSKGFLPVIKLCKQVDGILKGFLSVVLGTLVCVFNWNGEQQRRGSSTCKVVRLDTEFGLESVTALKYRA
jgi:hypothetical protein